MIGPAEVRRGDVVRYVDNTAVVPVAGDMLLAVEGAVNGEPVMGADGEVFVPVWTARAELEPTTVWVDWRNVIDIEPAVNR